MGATGFAHRIAKQFGLGLTEIRPALVPLTFDAEALEMMRPLSGVSLDCQALYGEAAFREGMLLTHRGLSGPAILQVSSYWREGEAITLDITPGQDAAERLIAIKRERARVEPKTALGEILPGRLAGAFAAELPARRMADLPDRTLRALGERLNGWVLNPSGTEGYAKAEVTLGGIDTDGLNAGTMEARTVPGLYAIGEAVDVTGWLGGYNFQWAWSSGWVAGMNA
jgi:predicted Rossmann fold flavoprotein